MRVVAWRTVTAVTRYCGVTWMVLGALRTAYRLRSFFEEVSAQPPVVRERRLDCATKVVVGSQRRGLLLREMIVTDPSGLAHGCRWSRVTRMVSRARLFTYRVGPARRGSLALVTTVSWKVTVIGRARGPTDGLVLNEGDGLVSSEAAGCLHAAERAREWLCEERVQLCGLQRERARCGFDSPLVAAIVN
jgi:hypothetical protein